MSRPKVFFSYSWDSEDHKRWVRRLAKDVSRVAGVDVILDQFEMWAGKDFARFMEAGLETDRVLMVLTPTYREKAMRRTGGVGYENTIITGQMFRSIEEDRFIPVLRGDPASSVPSYLATRQYIDMRRHQEYEIGLDEIARSLRRERGDRAKRSVARRVRSPATAWLDDLKRDDFTYTLKTSDLAYVKAENKIKSVDRNSGSWSSLGQGRNIALYQWLARDRLFHHLVGIEISAQGRRSSDYLSFDSDPCRFIIDIEPLDAIPLVSGVLRELNGAAWSIQVVRGLERQTRLPPFGMGLDLSSHSLTSFAVAVPTKSKLRRKDGQFSISITSNFEGH